eukprot:scaffold5281_cov211-Isochrysis_galbana.AAC.5
MRSQGRAAAEKRPRPGGHPEAAAVQRAEDGRRDAHAEEDDHPQRQRQQLGANRLHALPGGARRRPPPGLPGVALAPGEPEPKVHTHSRGDDEGGNGEARLDEEEVVVTAHARGRDEEAADDVDVQKLQRLQHHPIQVGHCERVDGPHDRDGLHKADEHLDLGLDAILVPQGACVREGIPCTERAPVRYNGRAEQQRRDAQHEAVDEYIPFGGRAAGARGGLPLEVVVILFAQLAQRPGVTKSTVPVAVAQLKRAGLPRDAPRARLEKESRQDRRAVRARRAGRAWPARIGVCRDLKRRAVTPFHTLLARGEGGGRIGERRAHVAGCATALRLEGPWQAVIARGAGGARLHGARRARLAGSHAQLGLELSTGAGIASADEQLGTARDHRLVSAVTRARLAERVDDQASRTHHLHQKGPSPRRGPLPAERTGAEVQI